MRILSQNEILRVAGAENSLITTHLGNGSLRVVPLDNGTVNIDMTVFGHTTTWNSGVAVACQTFGAGSGLMSLAFTGGSGAGLAWVAFAAAAGCQATVKYSGNMPVSPTDDGDA